METLSIEDFKKVEPVIARVEIDEEGFQRVAFVREMTGAERDDWDIVGEALELGDLIVFHMGCLHGGGATHPGMRRRSLVLRFIGDDVVWVERSDTPHPNSSIARRAKARAEGKSVAGASAGEAAPAPIGELVGRSNKYLRVRPWTK